MLVVTKGCLWAVLLCAGLAAAQQQKGRTPAASRPNPKAAPAPAAPTVYPLESLRVEGNRHLPADRIIAASGLKTGSIVDKAAFDAARDRLVATGAFENVGYEYQPSAAGTGYDGVLQVIEIEPVFPYRFEDLTVDETALRAALRAQEPLFDDRIPSTAAVLDRFTGTVEQAAGGTKVVAQLTADAPGQTVIVFHKAAARSNIAEVRFKGNRALPTSVLQRRIYEAAIGAPFSEATMRKMLDLGIRPLYDAQGRIRVAFPQITVEKAKNVDGVAVTIAVDEGPPYTLAEIHLAGVPASEASQMERAADWRTGDVANFDDVNAGLERVKQRYYSRGFLHVAAHTERSVDDAKHTVNVTAVVDLGPQFLFRKLEINGLDILSEPEIRKTWKLSPGKPFQPDYPDGFLAGIRDEGVFDNLGKTRAETRVDETAHTVDVTLFFSGAGPVPARTRRTQF
ncbi:MAG TPA: POTRA domain-containing protein [Bryobacteraceae bacterium]|nr:POTRA domain-containing protein [Bryobacteraceae bacterium]